MKKLIAVLLLSAFSFLPGCAGEDEKLIGVEKAKEIALSDAGTDAGEVTFKKTNLESDDGVKMYDIEFYSSDNIEYEYEIDAVTGNIITADREMLNPSSGNTDKENRAADDTDSLMNETDAKKKILDKLTGSNENDIREFKLETNDGIKVYIGKIVFENDEYKFEINAHTGEILNLEKIPV